MNYDIKNKKLLWFDLLHVNFKQASILLIQFQATTNWKLIIIQYIDFTRTRYQNRKDFDDSLSLTDLVWYLWTNLFFLYLYHTIYLKILNLKANKGINVVIKTIFDIYSMIISKSRNSMYKCL